MPTEEKQKYKIVTATIRVIDAKTDKIESETKKVIDGPGRREWLKTHVAKKVMWALLNGKYVEVINEADEKEPKNAE